MPVRRAVYTCLFGGYETLLDQPVAEQAPGIDFLCFTDDPQLTSDCWQVRHVAAPLPGDQNRNSRRPKILAHEYLPDHDESLYIDNRVLLTAPPERLFEWLTPDEPLALVRHSFRGAVEEEFSGVALGGYDSGAVLDEQAETYRRYAPRALAAQTLWGAVLVRRHHDPALRAAMQLWWEHVLRYSRRDQLSLPYALLTTGLPHRVLPLDNHVSEFHRWPREEAQRDPAGGAPVPPDLRLRVADLEAQLVQTRRDADEREARLHEQLDRAAEHATSLSGEVERLRREVADVHASTSWRVTRPLRAVSEAVRRRAASRPGAADPR